MSIASFVMQAFELILKIIDLAKENQLTPEQIEVIRSGIHAEVLRIEKELATVESDEWKKVHGN
jgi:hypothetical protein